MELFRCFENLARLGGHWKTERIGKTFFRDSIESTILVQVPEGVFRGVVLVTRQSDLSRVEAEVKFYLGGEIKEGKFKHGSCSADKTEKVCEYKDRVLYDFSRFFGIDLGWKPRKPIPVMHQRLIEMADHLVVAFDIAEVTDKANQDTRTQTRKADNKEVAIRALSR